MANLKRILKPLFAPLSLVNKVIPKNDKKLFFYSNLGFRDNVKSLYDYTVEIGLNETYKIVFSTDEYKKYKDRAPKNVEFISIRQGFFSFFTAKYCFYSFGKYPIMPSKNLPIDFSGIPCHRLTTVWFLEGIIGYLPKL